MVDSTSVTNDFLHPKFDLYKNTVFLKWLPSNRVTSISGQMNRERPINTSPYKSSIKIIEYGKSQWFVKNSSYLHGKRTVTVFNIR